MKRNLLLLFVIFSINSFVTKAQYSCGSGRFHDEIFSNVTITTNVTYGSAKDYTGTLKTLKMDIYQPTGDTASMRPVIIWGHGGSFVGGTKNDGDVVALATRFAKRGYVCVSYDYRLGMFPVTQTNASRAVYRATQDAKAVVRYLRKDAAETNAYKIDAGYINLGGSSAGAFIALHYAYLDDPTEIPAYLDTTGLGNIEGNTGSPGNCSSISSVINLCGALGSVSWMHAGDEPVCSMHGTVDSTVPYATDTIFLAGFPVMIVDGSHTVDSMATVIGLDHVFHTWIGANHVPYASSTTYMDSTVEFVRDFMCNQISKAPNCPVTASGIAQNNYLKAMDLIQVSNNGTSSIQIKNNSGEKINLSLMDMSGRLIRNYSTTETNITLEKENISEGMYFISLSGKDFRKTEKIIFLNH